MTIRLLKCSGCGVEPSILRDEPAMVVEIDCACGSFRWAPSEISDLGERTFDDIEEEAIRLWNVKYGER